MTRPEVEHQPVIDVVGGFVSCTCEDYTYRHAKHEPTVFCTDHHCKHITRALDNCKRNGQLAVSTQAPAPIAASAPQAASNFTMSAADRSAALQARINAGLVSVDDLF